MSDEIAALHGDLFEFVPPKAGTAYERIAALVLATLGWQNVAHDVSEQPVGRCAEHRLDVVAHDSAGVVGRLIVECKDYSKTVGEGTLNTLVGVREQLGAKAAAVVTTKGFTAGARAVAADEDIALIRLRHFDPETEKGNFVMKVIVTVNALFPAFSDFDVVMASSPTSAGNGEIHFALSGGDRYAD